MILKYQSNAKNLFFKFKYYSDTCYIENLSTLTSKEKQEIGLKTKLLLKN